MMEAWMEEPKWRKHCFPQMDKRRLMSAWSRTNLEDPENGFWWVWVLKGERRVETQEGSWELSLWKTHLDFIHENGTLTPTVFV
jgi:hypothetical protein